MLSRPLDCKGHYLTRRMHAGVGAPGSGHSDRVAGQPGQSLFQFFLNRSALAAGAAALSLKTEVSSAVILDGGPVSPGRGVAAHFACVIRSVSLGRAT